MSFRVFETTKLFMGDFDMNDSTEYNGWTNRETWLTNLWLTNDEALYSQLIATQGVTGDRAEWLAERIHERLDWHLKDAEASIWVDMLRASFYRVDWAEIVENNLE
jgi:hypothetical protein